MLAGMANEDLKPGNVLLDGDNHAVRVLNIVECFALCCSKRCSVCSTCVLCSCMFVLPLCRPHAHHDRQFPLLKHTLDTCEQLTHFLHW
jgi:hypothetical protein